MRFLNMSALDIHQLHEQRYALFLEGRSFLIQNYQFSLKIESKNLWGVKFSHKFH